MSSPTQVFEGITPDHLVARASKLKQENWRLACISAARLGAGLEVVYSFDLEYRLLNLRLELPLEQPHLPSISAVYSCSVLYENELHDLFNVQVDGMAVDFKGNLYRTAVKFPFGSLKPPQAQTASTSAAATPSLNAGRDQLSTRK